VAHLGGQGSDVEASIHLREPYGEARASRIQYPHEPRVSSRPQPSHLRLVAGTSTHEASDPALVRAPQPGAPSAEATPVDAEPSAVPSRRARAELAPIADEPAGPASMRRAGGLGSLTDAQLVGLARDGDSAAFEVLYRRHVAFALHLAARIEGSSRDVEDVVHDAFLKAFGRIGDLAEPAAFRSWLGSIVVFAVRSRLRRQRLMSLLGLGRGSEPVELDSLASSDASPHLRAQLAQVYALLRTQPTDDRIAWTLRYVEGNELEVVAKLAGCSLATVKRRISRAQKFLEEHFVPASSSDDAPEGDVAPPPASARTAPHRSSPTPDRNPPR
jgi:RNA polymerase sigma-70 factor (ECF subfamily)